MEGAGRRGGQIDSLLCSFFKNVSSGERVKPWFFVTFNTIIGHTFPEYFIEIPQVVSSLILTIFVNFPDFLTFPWYKETNDVSIKQMMATFF